MLYFPQYACCTKWNCYKSHLHVFGVFLLHLSDFVIVIIVPDNLGEDCPVFDDLFEFCQIYAGGTLGNRKIANASFCFVISKLFFIFQMRLED